MSIQDWNGRPVPWITRWSNEVVRQEVGVRLTKEGLRAAYKDGNNEYERGNILWQREGVTRGGVPQYAQVSTPRQRAAMRKRLCQVCGTKIPEGPIRWLLAPEVLHDGDKTMSAPTCDDCIPIALDLCPHLKKGDHVIAVVEEYELWAAYGNILFVDEEDTVRQAGQVTLPYDQPYEPTLSMIAQQEVARFTKFHMEEIE